MRRNCLRCHVLYGRMEGRIKWMETNEDVITLGKREDTGTSENMYCIVICGEIALERLWTCRKTDQVTKKSPLPTSPNFVTGHYNFGSAC
jgi:hypothetical protein